MTRDNSTYYSVKLSNKWTEFIYSWDFLKYHRDKWKWKIIEYVRIKTLHFFALLHSYLKKNWTLESGITNNDKDPPWDFVGKLHQRKKE